MMIVILKMNPTISCTPARLSWPSTACIWASYRLDIRPRETSSRIAENVMIPSAPICISPRITNCPNPEKSLPVSSTIRPVTQTADVAVNRAFTKPMDLPDLADIGRSSSSAPTRMATAKVMTINCAARSPSWLMSRAVRSPCQKSMHHSTKCRSRMPTRAAGTPYTSASTGMNTNRSIHDRRQYPVRAGAAA